MTAGDPIREYHLAFTLPFGIGGFEMNPSQNRTLVRKLARSGFSCLVAVTVITLATRCSIAQNIKHDFGGASTDEVYKTASDYDLWIYRFDPPGHDPETDRRPAVVFFFGGGWNNGSVTQFEQHAKYLAARGMVAFVADYRVKKRQNTEPLECVSDGKSAIRWVRRHAQRLGIDPGRIAAGGGSAGGHVAATTGICDGLDDKSEQDSPISSKANALLLFNPVYDNGPEGYGHSRIKDWFPAISPAHNISKDDPPTIVFLGSKDSLIPVSTAQQFHEKLKQVDVKSELWIYDGQPHGFFNEKRNQEAFIDTVLKMDQFLVSLGWLEGEPDRAKLDSLLTQPRG